METDRIERQIRLTGAQIATVRMGLRMAVAYAWRSYRAHGIGTAGRDRTRQVIRDLIEQMRVIDFFPGTNRLFWRLERGTWDGSQIADRKSQREGRAA